MVGVTAVRHRTGRSSLLVTSPSGINEQFLRQLNRDAASLRSVSRWDTVRRRLRGLVRGVRGVRSRRTTAFGLLAIFAATFLMGIAGTSERDVELTGTTGVARAAEGDCVSEDFDIRFVPGFVEDAIVDPINALCRAVSEVSRVISDYVITPISDAIWKAFHPNKFCGWRTTIDTDDPNTGFNSLMERGVEILIGKGDKAAAGTTWQEYGTAGTYWGTYFLDCFDSTQVANFGANFVLAVSKIFALIAILLFQQTFNSMIVDYFFVPQDGAPEAAIDTIIEELHVGLFVNFMAVAVVLGALVLLYRSLVLNGGLAEGLTKAAMMVLVAGVALAYVSVGSDYIQKVSGYTDDVGAAVLGALVGEGCNNSDGQPVPGNPEPYDCAAQAMYHVLIYVPWANGQIGTINVINDDAYTQQRRALADRILRQQAYTQAESRQINDPDIGEDERVRLTERLEKENSDDRLAMVRDDWGARFIAKDGEQEADFTITGEDSWRPHDHVDTDYPEFWNLFSGKLAGQRFIIAIMALIGSISLGFVLISVATAYLVLQLMTIILALAAPIVFLVGLVPGYGYRIFLKWFELLAGLFIKRLALVVFVGVLLAGLQLVFSVAAPWWLHMLAAVCVGLVGLAYRHQLSSWASTGMEGMGKVAGIATGGLMGMKDGVKSVKHAKATWQGSKGLPGRQRARAAAGAAYGAHQTGPHQAAYTASRRQPITAGQPQSRRQRRKARKRARNSGQPVSYQTVPVNSQQPAPQAIEAPPPTGVHTGMGPGSSSRRGTYMYRG